MRQLKGIYPFIVSLQHLHNLIVVCVSFERIAPHAQTLQQSPVVIVDGAENAFQNSRLTRFAEVMKKSCDLMTRVLLPTPFHLSTCQTG